MSAAGRRSRPSGELLAVSLLTLVGVAAGFLWLTVHGDQGTPRPNSVANCDTPAGLK